MKGKYSIILTSKDEIMSANKFTVISYSKGNEFIEKLERISSSNVTPISILLFLTICEIAALNQPTYGLLMHSILVIAILSLSSISQTKKANSFLIASLPIPMVRIVSLSAPLVQMSIIEWFLLISSLLLLSIFLSLQQSGITPREVGFRWPEKRNLPIVVAVIALGIPLGFVEHRILDLESIVQFDVARDLFVPFIAMYLGTGILEELLFRGLIQKTSIDLYGKGIGLLFTTVSFMIMHIGWDSIVDVIFVGAVGLFYSFVILRTKSLFSISISHTMVNLSLFILAPTLINI